MKLRIPCVRIPTFYHREWLWIMQYTPMSAWYRYISRISFIYIFIITLIFWIDKLWSTEQSVLLEEFHSEKWDPAVGVGVLPEGVGLLLNMLTPVHMGQFSWPSWSWLCATLSCPSLRIVPFTELQSLSTLHGIPSPYKFAVCTIENFVINEGGLLRSQDGKYVTLVVWAICVHLVKQVEDPINSPHMHLKIK